MDDRLEYGWATSNDLPDYENFISATYGPTAVQAIPGRARWLFWQHPFGLHVGICRSRGRIVGACGHLPHPVTTGGYSVLAAFGVDMMVEHAMRRRGIARHLLDMRLERFSLSLSSGQSNDMAAVYDKTNALTLGALHLGRWRRRPPRFGQLRQFARDLAAWLQPRLRAQQVRPIQRAPLSLEEACRWADSLAGHESGPESWSAWLRWRYGGPIYRDYSFWQVTDGNGHTGLLVTRQEGDAEHVVDLFTSDDQRPALLAAIGATTMTEVSVLAAGRNLVSDLRVAGFLVRKRAGHFVAVPGIATDQRIDGLEDLVLWAGSSDADLIRFPSP